MLARADEMGANGQTEPNGQRASERLDSWKAIAAYLKRDTRTVQRWEKSGDLPVHRHFHGKAWTVYAYGYELDAWWHAVGERISKGNGEAAGRQSRPVR